MKKDYTTNLFGKYYAKFSVFNRKIHDMQKYNKQSMLHIKEIKTTRSQVLVAHEYNPIYLGI
jgi:hypothetical protein